MVIRRKREHVPSELPPAKLYLDDIESIVDIFETEHEQTKGKMQTTFRVGGQECTTVGELREIGKRLKELEIVTRSTNSPYAEHKLDITDYSVRLRTYSGSPTTDWAIYGQVHEVFQRHPSWWKRAARDLSHYVPWWLLIAFYAIGNFIDHLLPHDTAHTRPISGTEIVVLVAIFLIFGVGGYLAFFKHSTVILRYSHESRFPRLKEHIPQAIIAIAAAILGALIAAFIRHK